MNSEPVAAGFQAPSIEECVLPLYKWVVEKHIHARQKGAEDRLG
jgi:hypothetical protein